MKETIAKEMISEASKYGLAILVLSVMLILSVGAILMMWRYIVNEGKLNREALTETRDAFMELKHSIDLLAAKL